MAKQTWVNVGGTWRKVKSAWINVNGTWRKDVMPKGVVQGNYKEFMQYAFSIYISVGGEVRKLDKNGEELWGVGNHSENIEKIAVDPSGYVYSVAWDNTTRKTNPNGVQVWSHRYSGNRRIHSVAVDKEGFVYAGTEQMTALKIHPEGHEETRFTNIDEYGYIASIELDNSGFIYAGTSNGSIVKLRPDGTRQWRFIDYNNTVKNMVIHPIGEVYGAGAGSYGQIKRISVNGSQIWGINMMSYNHFIRDLAMDANVNIYTSTANANGALIRLSQTSGSEVWNRTHTQTVNGIGTDPDGYIYIGASGWVKKINANGGTIWQSLIDGLVMNVRLEPGLLGAFSEHW